MPKERELTVAEFRAGAVAKADTWLTVERQDNPNVPTNVGINLKDINDYVVVRLANGDTVEIYGDGETWFRGANLIRIATDALPWR